MNEYRIEEAERRRQQETARLYRADGTKYFSDEEHKERERRIKAEFGETMGRIEADLQERIGRAQERILVHENADPTDLLSASELGTASAKKPFVADECFTLPMDKLAARLKAVLAKGDRAAMFSYAHHALQRVGEEPEVEPSTAASYVARSTGGYAGEEEVAPREEAGAGEERELVAELRRALDPDREGRIAKARRDLEEAEELRFTAALRRQGGVLYAPNASYRTS